MAVCLYGWLTGLQEVLSWRLRLADWLALLPEGQAGTLGEGARQGQGQHWLHRASTGYTGPALATQGQLHCTGPATACQAGTG